jgi:cardiolipin synthase A/B
MHLNGYRRGPAGTDRAATICMRVRSALLVMVPIATMGCTVQTPSYVMSPLPITGAEFRQAVEANTRSPIVADNEVDLLRNGDEYFPPMLQAIRSARKSITFEQYVYEKPGIAEQFTDALAERCRAGIGVNILLDAAGAFMVPSAYIDRLRLSGCHVEFFRPLNPWQVRRANHRTHRRLLIVDGALAFTGGFGVSEKWTGDGTSEGHWRDTVVRVRGPVVRQLQEAFMQDWRETTGIILDGDPYLPRLTAAGPAHVQVVASSPIGGSYDTYLVLLLTMSRARRSIEITNPYFLPDRRLQETLLAAVRKGVKVRVLLPAKIDHFYVRSASRRSLGKLMRAGIEVYEYQPALLHSKTVVIDNVWATVGSANFDKRSFALNEELNVAIYDRDFGQRMAQMFEDDLKHSRALTYRRWHRRGLHERLVELMTLPLEDEF